MRLRLRRNVTDPPRLYTDPFLCSAAHWTHGWSSFKQLRHIHTIPSLELHLALRKFHTAGYLVSRHTLLFQHSVNNSPFIGWENDPLDIYRASVGGHAGGGVWVGFDWGTWRQYVGTCESNLLKIHEKLSGLFDWKCEVENAWMEVAAVLDLPMRQEFEWWWRGNVGDMVANLEALVRDLEVPTIANGEPVFPGPGGEGATYEGVIDLSTIEKTARDEVTRFVPPVRESAGTSTPAITLTYNDSYSATPSLMIEEGTLFDEEESVELQSRESDIATFRGTILKYDEEPEVGRLSYAPIFGVQNGEDFEVVPRAFPQPRRDTRQSSVGSMSY